MSENPQKFYLTTPIYYVNARPHIGHAYTTIVADVIARRHRLLGHDTFLLTGTDEHGQKIERSAAAAGIPPQQFADEVSAAFRALWDRMGMMDDAFSKNDPLFHRDFIRTTSSRHARGVARLWRKIEESGDIYLDTYTGQYCVSNEAFYDVPPGAPCPECGRITETVTEENYYFRLSKYQDRLIHLIESGELSVEPETRRNEVLSFLRGNTSAIFQSELESPAQAVSAAGTAYIPGALKDLSISRTSFRWGIPAPGNEKHVIYVWLDALANYMTAIGYGSDAPEDIAKFERYWPADLHLVGKEIIRFHCVYWPAFLMAAGLPLPKKVQAHGWLLFEESKMSKSRGNIVRAETILDAFGDEVYGKQFPESTKAERDLFGTDVLRYFLLREIPFGNDGSFSFDALITRYNADLANGYGNLVSRTLGLIQQNFPDGLPKPSTPWLCPDRNVWWGNEEPKQEEKWSGTHFIISEISGLFELANNLLWPTVRFQILLTEALLRISHVDGYLSFHKPWLLAKSDDDEQRRKLIEVLYTAADSIRRLTAFLYPVLPYSTAMVWSQLGLVDIEIAAKNGELNNLQWGGLKPGTKLGPLGPIFPRADKGLAQLMNNIENPTPQPTEQPAPTPEQPPVTGAPTPEAPAEKPEASPTIGIEDFAKIDLRAATVLVAERIPKADKLLRLEVDLGTEKRQILSGIAQWYTPEELIGRKIVVIANLAPRKMRGLESHGMLLAASEGENGKPILATFGEDIAPGSRLK